MRKMVHGGASAANVNLQADLHIQRRATSAVCGFHCDNQRQRETMQQQLDIVFARTG